MDFDSVRFDLDRQLVKELEKIELREITGFYEEFIQPGAKKRAKLLVYLSASHEKVPMRVESTVITDVEQWKSKFDS